ncbi:MAG: SpoIIE family protein phosphatase, partial [Chitinivibrionales bacterium]|nr:SpoIIE family protein phosphatase [Chitinivibrionales bacterium]MBD3358188.1 SpoIIE family protein phosphatase [Chitinivibrionales bacterium]
LKSTNGVFLNGERVTVQKVQNNDVVACGSSVFRVRLQSNLLGNTLYYKSNGGEKVPGDTGHQAMVRTVESEQFQRLFECMLAIQRIVGGDSPDMIEQSLRTLFMALPVTRLCLLSVDEKGAISPWYTTTLSGVTREFTMSKTFAHRVLEEGKGILIQDARSLDSAEWGSTMQQQEVRSILGIPVWNKGRAIAILLCDNLDEPDILRDVHVRTLEFFGKALETVFQRDELRALEESQAQTERAFLAARRVQKQIFTKRPSSAMGGMNWAFRFRPALEVGGDFYDFYETPEHAYWIVADVTGKGVSAALVVSMLKGFCKMLFPRELAPHEMMIELNGLLQGELPPEMFLTAIIIMVDRDGLLIHSNAGHNPGLVARCSGDGKPRFHNIKSAGVPLGVLGDNEFCTRIGTGTFQLERGDKLCLYTDGVTEAVGQQGAFFGERGLLAAFEEVLQENVEAAVQRIYNKIEEFQGTERQHDDITIVLGQY